MAHVVITGAAGFVGSHLCDALRARGERVTAFDDLSTGALENLAQFADDPEFRFVRQDVCLPLAVEDPVDAVLHFASPASPREYFQRPIATLHAGSLATHQATSLAAEKGARFLLASTSEVYGDPEVTPQPESYVGHVNPIGPRSCYDEAKRYAEAYTMAMRRTSDLDTRIVRLFNTYGPRMQLGDGRVLPAFIGAIERGEALVVFGDGEQTRAFSYVEDTVRGILLVLDRGDSAPVNVGRPGELSILEFAQLLLEVAGVDLPIRHEPALADDPRRREPDIARLRALGFEPAVPPREGLARTLAWFRERREASRSGT